MIATSIYPIVFRIIHITAGVIWVGSVFMFVVFVQPSAAAVAPSAGRFMSELLGKRHFVDALLGFASVTIAGGLFLYWHDQQIYGGLREFLHMRMGVVLTIGALSAITAFLFGLFGTRPRVMRFLGLAGQAAAAAESGEPPSPEIVAQMGALQAQLKILARVSLAFVLVAVLAMSTARYW